MPIPYILIIVLQANGANGASGISLDQVAQYDTKAACEAAAKAPIVVTPLPGSQTGYICIMAPVEPDDK